MFLQNQPILSMVGDSDQGFTAENYARCRRRSLAVATGFLIPSNISLVIVNGSGADMPVGSKHSAYPALPVNGNRMDSWLSDNHRGSGILSISDLACRPSAAVGISLEDYVIMKESDYLPKSDHGLDFQTGKAGKAIAERRFTSNSSPIKAVRIRLRDSDSDSNSDSDSDPEPAAFSSFTSSSERSGNRAGADPSQTVQLGLSIGRCGLRTGRGAVVRRWHEFELSYMFDDCYPEEAKPAVSRAFQTWSDASSFSFREISEPGRAADITIMMCRGDHGDGHPFKAGPGGVLAHAFYPTDGRLHFNVDQPWSYSLDPPRPRGLYDLQSVATHEIGHVLGLGHILNRKAVMYKEIKPNQIRRCLTAKDKRKLKSLYSSHPKFA